MFNFKNCITDIIKIYEQNATYKEKNISLTRSLEHYVKINDKFELIKVKEIKNILNLYKDYLKENNLPIDEEINDNFESDYDKKKPSDYSDSESDSNESELNIENNISDNDNSNGSDDNDNNYLSNNVGIKLKIGNKSNGDNNLKYKNKSKRYRNKNNKLDNNGMDIYDNSLSNNVNSIFKKIYFEDSSINEFGLFSNNKFYYTNNNYGFNLIKDDNLSDRVLFILDLRKKNLNNFLFKKRIIKTDK